MLPKWINRPEWYQLLGLLAPLFIVIYGLRWREFQLANTPYSKLTPTQRGFVFLHNLPPGTAAKFWDKLEPWEQESYRTSAKGIRGSGKPLVAPMVKEVLKAMAENKEKPPSTESNDPLEKLSLAAEYKENELFSVLRDRFPAQRVAPSPAAQG